MARPAGGGSTSGGGGIPAPGPGGPWWYDGGAWSLATAGGLPANPDADVQTLLDGLDTAVGTLDTDVTALDGDVGTLQTTTGTHTTQIGTLQTDVGALQTSVSSNTTNITALQGTTWTRSEVTVALGNAPTYATVLTLTIPTGTVRGLQGVAILAGGTQAAPTRAAVAFADTSTLLAQRTSGGTVSVTGAPVTIGGTIGSLGAQWIVSGTDVVLQVRATGGPTVKATFFYRWDTATPAP